MANLRDVIHAAQEPGPMLFYRTFMTLATSIAVAGVLWIAAQFTEMRDAVKKLEAMPVRLEKIEENWAKTEPFFSMATARLDRLEEKLFPGESPIGSWHRPR